MFRMSVQYELADIMALSKFHSRTEGKRRRIGELLFATLICAYEIYCIVVCVKYHAWSVPNIAVLILDALAIAYLALLPQISALIMWRRNKDLPAQEMRFDEKEMQSRGKNELFSYQYACVKGVYHARDVYYVGLEGKRLIRIPERSFVEGDPAAFGAFLAAKTGLEVKELN